MFNSSGIVGRATVISSIALLFAFGCGDSDDDGNGNGGNNNNGGTNNVNNRAVHFPNKEGCDSPAKTVTVGPGGELRYEPKKVTISAGEIVKWEWDSGEHTVTAGDNCGNPDASWGSTQGTAVNSETCYKFNEPGTYPYLCNVGDHCSQGMKGTVEVN